MSAASADVALSAAGLVRRFGPLTAVDNVGFEVRRGEVFGLVGPDGAGKTTIMRMLATVLRPDAGTISIEGINAVADPEAAKSAISYMPQRFGLYEDLTVAENLFFYAELFAVPRKERIARGAQLLEAAGLTPFQRRLAGRLSGGMKQKLGLVCALIHTPRVLLLDEPTTGVDPVSRRDFWAILYNLRESGVSIVLSTAYMDEAERCSRLALLHAGKIRICDTPAGLKQAMPGALVAVATDHPRAVRDALQDAPGVLSILVMGDHVNVRVDDADRRAPELRARLAARGVSVTDVERIEPGIEDVFVALVGAGA
jgi:ABC-2 type transport system ATP-binding protein